MLKIPSNFGPQIILKESSFGIRGREGQILAPSTISEIGETISSILAVNFLCDLSYPASYGQLLGFFQEMVLEEPFVHKSKKCATVISKFKSE